MSPTAGASAGLTRRRFMAAAGAAAGVLLLAGGAACQRIWPAPAYLPASDRAIIDALAVTLFPGNPGPPGDRAAVADFVAWYFREAADPAASRTLRALLGVLEWGCLAATGKRFTRQDRSGREAFYSALERHPAHAIRLAATGMKLLVSMAYFECPETVIAVGIARPCD